MVVAALVIAVAVPSAAAPGQLDPAFGAGGTAVTEFSSSYSGARAVAVQADGRVVAAGFAHTDNSILQDIAVVRYDATGELDPTFGSGGRVRTDFGGRFDEALAVAVQSDGRIVVAGSTADATGSDSRLDRGFGVGGVVITPVSPSTDEVGGLARGPAGQVMVAGTTAVSQGVGFFVSRYRLT
jgi:uncharacterized delta-60 repeat protein